MMQKMRQAERRPYLSASEPTKKAEMAAARKPIHHQHEVRTNPKDLTLPVRKRCPTVSSASLFSSMQYHINIYLLTVKLTLPLYMVYIYGPWATSQNTGKVL